MLDTRISLRLAIRKILVTHTAVGAATAVCIALLPDCSVAAQSGPANSPLDTVLVEGQRIGEYKLETSSLSKLTEKLLDTPQSITSVNEDELEARAIAATNDALRSVPGITLGAGETSWQGTNPFLRGFTTRNDMFLDGMRDYGYYYRDPFNNSSIEVLKGPASILFGRGSTGGVIQQVSKRATLQGQNSGSLLFGTDESRRATFDIGGRAQKLGETAAVRLNAMIHDAEVADRDGAKQQRWGVAPTLALGLGTPTRLHVSYFHQSDDIRPDYGLPWFHGRPAPTARNNYYGFESDYLRTAVDIATVLFEHDFGANATLRNQARYSRAKRSFRISEPVIPAGTPATTPPENIVVSRNVFQGYSTDKFAQNQTDLVVRFSSGSVSHTLVAGFEIGREEPNPVYVTNVGMPTTNLAHPERQAYSVVQSYPRLAARTEADTIGVYMLDTIKFGDRWRAILGARWDRFDADYYSVGFAPDGTVISTTDTGHVDSTPSYRAALVFKPVEQGTVYVSYGESFNPSAEGIESLISSGRAVAQANLNLDAEENRTYEIGVKWDLIGGAAMVAAAAFRIEKLNARVPDPDVTGFNTLGGEQRVDGFEVELVGRLLTRWTVRAGYTYLDSEVVRTTPGGPVLGAPLTMAPRHTASVWSEYALPAGLQVGVGVTSVSSRLAQNTASSYLVAPGYTTIDAMMRYRLSETLAVQLNVNNLTDKYYYDQLHPFHVIPGPGRTALLSLRLSY